MSKNQEGVISDVDYMLEAAGLPSYSLLQRSCEEATKFVLSLTKEPRTGCSVGTQQVYDCGCGYTHFPWEKCRTASQQEIQKETALTLLRPQPNETISQWATRYVATMLSDSEAITGTPRR